MKQLFRSVLAIAAVCAAAPALHAQSASASAVMSVEVQRSGYISLTSNVVSFPAPTAADIQRGYTQPVTVGLRYGGNATIALSYQFDSPSLTGSLGGAIPVSNIVQSFDGQTEADMTQFGTAWRDGIAPGDYSETLTYALRVGWSTVPQSYSANVTYIISVS
jgi:hypothetical protein